MIFLNREIQASFHTLFKDKRAISSIIKGLNILIGATGQFSITVESVIQCLTFRRLDIRHTCCASLRLMHDTEYFPSDYGSDFGELKEEDSDRVLQLDDLVPKFVNQYENSGLSLKDFLIGPWIKEMNRIEEEERLRWTTQEKDTLLSIGVVPDDSPKPVHPARAYGPWAGPWGERKPPEYWNKQFEIIVNGGRSVEERW